MSHHTFTSHKSFFFLILNKKKVTTLKVDQKKSEWDGKFLLILSFSPDLSHRNTRKNPIRRKKSHFLIFHGWEKWENEVVADLEWKFTKIHLKFTQFLIQTSISTSFFHFQSTFSHKLMKFSLKSILKFFLPIFNFMRKKNQPPSRWKTVHKESSLLTEMEVRKSSKLSRV